MLLSYSWSVSECYCHDIHGVCECYCHDILGVHVSATVMIFMECVCYCHDIHGVCVCASATVMVSKECV